MSVVMKPSGVQWIGDIPDHWVKDKLYRLTDFVSSGGTPTSTNPDYYEDGDIVWIQTGDLNDGYVNETSKKITQYGLENSSAKIFDKGTLLMAMYGATIGKLGIMTIDAATNQACCAMKYDTKTNTKFMYYIFLAMRTHLINQSYGGGQPNISQEVVKQQYLCFPKYSEQGSIANFLDKATSQIDNAIKTKQTQLETLETLKKSIIHKAVTKGLNASVSMKDSGIEWIGEIPEHCDIKRLFSICNFVRGNSTFQKNELLDEGKYVALQYGKTYKVEEINEQFKFYVNDKFYKSSQVVNYEDTIFLSTSETIKDLGHSVFYNRKDIGLIGGEQILLKPNKNILDGKYLFYSSKVFGKELKKFATGIKVFRFDVYDLKTIYIPTPPLEEQIEIASFLDKEVKKIDTLKANVKNQINKLKEYKKSLIYEYVTGKKQVKE